MSNPLEPNRKKHLRKAIEHLSKAIDHLDEAQDREAFFPVELENASRETVGARDAAIRVLKEGTSATEHEVA
jgi:hypothetical protein